MQTPREILADLWTSAGGDPSALDAVTLTGDEPQLPSSFRVARRRAGHHRGGGAGRGADLEAAQRASAERRRRYAPCRRRMPQRALSARRRQAAAARPGTPIAGIYKTRDGRFVRLHTNFRTSPRRRLQGAGLRARARKGPGRADAVGRRGVRDRGLCRRRRGRDDALARRMVCDAACARRWPNCR